MLPKVVHCALHHICTEGCGSFVFLSCWLGALYSRTRASWLTRWSSYPGKPAELVSAVHPETPRTFTVGLHLDGLGKAFQSKPALLAPLLTQLHWLSEMSTWFVSSITALQSLLHACLWNKYFPVALTGVALLQVCNPAKAILGASRPTLWHCLVCILWYYGLLLLASVGTGRLAGPSACTVIVCCAARPELGLAACVLQQKEAGRSSNPQSG